MASTQYNSIIELFRGCPFSVDSAHTLEPMPISNKITWLEGNCDYNAADDRFTNMMYIRCDSSSNRGTFRLECLDSRAFDYNYAYINNLRGTTYFAYITGCRYINDASVPAALPSKSVYEFDFTLDLLMTNLHSTSQLKPCMVARQHLSVDMPYENQVEEPINIGNIKNYATVDLFGPEAANLHISGTSSDLLVVFGYVDPEHTTFLDNVFAGLTMRCFRINDPAFLTVIRAFLKKHAADDTIKFGYMVPYDLVNHFYTIDWEALDESGGISAPLISGTAADPIDITPDSVPTRFGTYTLKNEKTGQYPYVYRTLSDGNGHEIDFKNECWYNWDQKFHLYFTLSGNPAIRIVPVGYKRDSAAENMDCAFTITGFPMVSWSCTAFDRWISDSMLGRVVDKVGKWYTNQT